MKRGAYTTVDHLSKRLLHRFVPKWHEAFCVPETGGFYERLNKNFKPVMTGQRRLLTHCRQLAMYSHASIQPECGLFKPDLEAHFAHMLKTYRHRNTGGWLFSVDDRGAALDTSNDFYALAFVIFACAHYYRTGGDAQAREVADQTFDLVNTSFRIKGLPGFAEALDENLKPVEKTRRQNPHMHFLEACLFAYETWKESKYLEMADEITGLFHDYFFQPEQAFFPEFYDEHLKPHPEDGHILEPGHYFEWIWLLKKHASFKNNPQAHDEACKILLAFAGAHGWDEKYGGIYDEIDVEGNVLKDTKRLWPFTEALKANVLMLDSGMDKDALKKRIGMMARVFKERYMDERGFWTEWLSRELKPTTDYMPGTTPYHVYFGIMESRAVLKARGPSASITGTLESKLYAARRTASGWARYVRKSLLKKAAE